MTRNASYHRGRPGDPRPADYAAYAAAEAGSAALLSHCERAFDRFAAKHRITHDEARFLLVSSGVRL